MTYPPQPGGYYPYGQQPGVNQPAYGGTPGPPAQPGNRPQQVTIGAMSMVALAILALFNALIGVIFNNQIESNYAEWCEDLYSDSSYSPSCESQSPGSLGFQMFVSLFSFLWVLAFIGTALFVLRGFNWARITGFVVNGIFIAWQFVVMICAGVMTAAIESASRSLDNSGTSTSSSVDEIIPGWYFPATLIVSIISMAIGGLSLAFLANRQSSEWFRANSMARAAGVI